VRLGTAAKNLGKAWGRLSESEKKNYEVEAGKAKVEFLAAHPRAPPAPKRPVNGYLLWANEERPKLTEGKTSYNVKDIAKALGERWRGLDSKTRATFASRAATAMEHYKAEHPTEKKVKKVSAAAE